MTKDVPLMEACAAVGIGYHVGWRLIAVGKLSARRQLGRWYVDVGELRRAIAPVPFRAAVAVK